MRKTLFGLPSFEEIKAILAKESDIDIPAANQNKHFVTFHSLINVLDYLGIDASIFKNDYAQFHSGLDKVREFLSNLEPVLPHLEQAVYSKAQKPEFIDLLNDLYKYLAKEDKPEKADLIFVFGSKAKFRIDRALQIYKSGFANKILISGKGPSYDINAISEAESLASYARRKGVRRDSILIEPDSISIPDNVKRSLKIIYRHSFKKIILVNSPFSQRRGYAHFLKFSHGLDLLRVNANVSDKFSENAWFKNKDGLKVVFGEYIKMHIAYLLNTI